MGLVISEMSMSLDGYIAGPNAGVDNPLGDGGDRLHRWIYPLESWREPQGLTGGRTDRDSKVVEESSARAGAFVMGRRMFDTGERPWGESPPFGRPVFVLTHHARETLVKDGGTTFTFVTDGGERALEQARAAAGDKDVTVSGGANVVQQLIKAGLLDELEIHLIPVLLGGGIRLLDNVGPDHIELQRTRAIDSPAVTHLRFRFVR
jgi:dihydrofolate reductase